MEKILSGRDLEDFIVKHAEVFEADSEVVSLLKYQDEIVWDEPVQASKIQAELNFLIREYMKKNSIYEGMFGPLNLSHDLVSQKLEDNIQDYNSEQARSYIRKQLTELQRFYGVR